MCVQNLNDSRGLAIRITYRISLRSSSLWEPRHPLLKVVFHSISFLSTAQKIIHRIGFSHLRVQSLSFHEPLQSRPVNQEIKKEKPTFFFSGVVCGDTNPQPPDMRARHVSQGSTTYSPLTLVDLKSVQSSRRAQTYRSE